MFPIARATVAAGAIVAFTCSGSASIAAHSPTLTAGSTSMVVAGPVKDGPADGPGGSYGDDGTGNNGSGPGGSPGGRQGCGADGNGNCGDSGNGS